MDPVTAKLIADLSVVLVTSLIRIGKPEEAEEIKNSTNRALGNYAEIKDWSET